MIKIEGIKTLLFEAGKPVIKEADIYVENDRISKVVTGENRAVPAEYEGNKSMYTISGREKLAMPGLVNSHTHAYMTLFRNMADDVPFTTWLFDTVSPLEDEMVPEESYYGTLLGNIEMIRTGTTSYVDMYISQGVNAKAIHESGLRGLLTRGLVGSDRNDEGGIRRLNEAKAEMKEWSDGDMIRFYLAPHAPYTCGPDYLKFVAENARELGTGINIHLAEGTTEIANIRKQYNVTPIEYALQAGAFDVPSIAAHCVYLQEEDFDILREKGVNVAVNPVSNMKLANGFSNVPKMLEKGVNVCIGTDGAASNNTLNMFREMAVESLIHKGLKCDAIGVSAADVIKMATLGGARAMGLEGEIGEIKEGMKADITILDLHSPNLIPYNNLVSALCYSCNGSEVDSVIVNGKILMEHKELKTIDEERVYYEVLRIGERFEKIVQKQRNKK